MRKLLAAVLAAAVLAAAPVGAWAKQGPSSSSAPSSSPSRSTGSWGSSGSYGSKSVAAPEEKKKPDWGSSGSYGSKTAAPAPAPAADKPAAKSDWSSSNSWGSKPIDPPKPAPQPMPASVAPAAPGAWSSTAPKVAAGATPWDRKGAAELPASTAARGGVLGDAAGKSASQAALKRLQDEKVRYQGPAQDTAAIGRSASSYRDVPVWRDAGRGYTADRHYSERDSWLGQQHWQPPAVIYQSRPSFGLWDAAILWAIVHNASNRDQSAWMYHHQDDPGVRDFMREADRLSAQDAQLRSDMDRMKVEMDQMKAQNAKIDPSYVPPGLTPAAMIAPEAAMAVGAHPAGTGSRPTLSVSTGSEKGNYHAFCKALQAAAEGVSIECRPSQGSEQNLAALSGGQAGAALAQAGAVASHGGAAAVGAAYGSTLYPEEVHLVANAQAKVSSSKDLDPARHTIYLLGSGAKDAWNDAKRADPQLSKFDSKLREVPASIEALNAVGADKDGAAIFVSGQHSELIDSADASLSGKIILAGVDWKLGALKDQDGNTLYWSAKIPSRTYANIQKGVFGTGYFSGVDTVATGAVLLVSKAWIEQAGPEGQLALEKAVKTAIPAFDAKIGVKP